MRHISVFLVLLLIGVLGLSQAAVPEEDLKPVQDFTIAWQEDFNESGSCAGAIYYKGEDPLGEQVPELLVCSVKDGIATIGGKPFATGTQKQWRVSLGWGEGMSYGSWRWFDKKWSYDVKEFPILEIRARNVSGFKSDSRLIAVFTSGAGTIYSDFVLGELESNWREFSFRMDFDAGDRTPQTLTGVCLFTIGFDDPTGLEVDWVRVRSNSKSERVSHAKEIFKLSDYRLPECNLAKEIFPFSVYGPQDTAMLAGGLEGVYGDMVRIHLNYIVTPQMYAYFRFMDRQNPEEEFIQASRQAIVAAKAAGIRLGLDVRGFAPPESIRQNLKYGPDEIESGIRKIAEAFMNEEVVLSYTITDEPSLPHLSGVVAIKQIFEKVDPGRACLFPLNGPDYAETYDPYTTVHLIDRYPIFIDKRDPWMIGNDCQQMSRISHKPFWMILQTYGQLDWWNKPVDQYAYPSAAELRLMTYLAVSNGAKGIFYWDMFSPHHQGLMDQFGNPFPLLTEVRAIGDRLIPIGHLLLHTQLVDSLGFEVKTEKPIKRELTLNLLEDAEKKVHYLVVVNNDIKQNLSGKVKIDRKKLGSTEQVYDLYSLSPVSESSVTEFSVEELVPGDGRVYVLASSEVFGQIRRELLLQQAKEVLRVMTPDISIANRWKLNMAHIQKLKLQTEAEIVDGRGEEALSLAQEAAKVLKELMASNEALSQCQEQLTQIRENLGRVAPHMTIAPNTPNPKTTRFYSVFLNAGQKYSNLRSRFIAGEIDGLLADIQAHEGYVDKLTKQIFLRAKE